MREEASEGITGPPNTAWVVGTEMATPLLLFPDPLAEHLISEGVRGMHLAIEGT